MNTELVTGSSFDQLVAQQNKKKKQKDSKTMVSLNVIYFDIDFLKAALFALIDIWCFVV